MLRGLRSADCGGTSDSGGRNDHSSWPHRPWVIGQPDEYSEACLYPPVQHAGENQQGNSRGPMARPPAQLQPAATQALSAARRDFPRNTARPTIRSPFRGVLLAPTRQSAANYVQEMIWPVGGKWTAS